jgi:hypothetical protein
MDPNTKREQRVEATDNWLPTPKNTKIPIEIGYGYLAWTYERENNIAVT